MAGERCGQCEWWERTGTTGWCHWAKKNLPLWLSRSLLWGSRDNEMRIHDGSGCPQFKRRDEK